MKQRISLQSFSVAVLLAIGVIGFTQALTGFSLVRAAVHTFTTTWDATQMLGAQIEDQTVLYHGAQNSSGATGTWTNPGQVAVGVAEWTVKGTTPEGTKFKEVWSIPGGKNFSASIGTVCWRGSNYLYLTTPTLSTSSCPNTSVSSTTNTFNPGDWNYGIVGRGKVDFFVAPLSSFVSAPSSGYVRYNHVNTGTSAQCVTNMDGIFTMNAYPSDVAGCTYSSGNYSVSYSPGTGVYSIEQDYFANVNIYSQIQSVSEGARDTSIIPYDTAFMMPNHWDIAGTYCDAPTDTQCN